MKQGCALDQNLRMGLTVAGHQAIHREALESNGADGTHHPGQAWIAFTLGAYTDHFQSIESDADYPSRSHRSVASALSARSR